METRQVADHSGSESEVIKILVTVFWAVVNDLVALDQLTEPREFP